MSASKEIRYRALKLAEQKGISFEAALPIAEEENKAQEASLKLARRDVFAEKGRKVQKAAKKKQKKGPLYTVGGSVVSSVVSGGAPGLGKKS